MANSKAKRRPSKLVIQPHLSTTEQRWLAKAHRFERNGWIFLHIEGQPRERGFQHGYLMAREIAEIINLADFNMTWSTGNDFDFFVNAAKKLYFNIDAEVAAEIGESLKAPPKLGCLFRLSRSLLGTQASNFFGTGGRWPKASYLVACLIDTIIAALS